MNLSGSTITISDVLGLDITLGMDAVEKYRTR